MARARTRIVDHGRARSRWQASDPFRSDRKGGGASPQSLLKTIENFGPNPGALEMLAYAPKYLPKGAPLIVVLHGCSQNAIGYDTASGWSQLAGELGFAVLYPEQKYSNNPGGCFNWFQPADTARGLGETRSIHDMVEHMVERHQLDRSRIFVTGLSAGGAMTSALLADYPEVFAAGAVIAGLACGAATSVQEAFQVMSRPTDRTPEQLGDLVRAGSRHEGPWPRVLVVHGTRDQTVAPKNADELVKQWVDVHDASLGEFRESFVNGHRRRIWVAGGKPVVESLMVAGMGHGTPLDSRLGEQQAPFMLDVGLSSTRRIADFFGIDGALDAKPAPLQGEALPSKPAPKASRKSTKTGAGADKGKRPDESDGGSTTGGRFDVAAVINKALRAAGLMK